MDATTTPERAQSAVVWPSFVRTIGRRRSVFAIDKSDDLYDGILQSTLYFEEFLQVLRTGDRCPDLFDIAFEVLHRPRSSVTAAEWCGVRTFLTLATQALKAAAPILVQNEQLSDRVMSLLANLDYREGVSHAS